MTKKQDEIKVIGAAAIMENLFTAGTYQKYKTLEVQIDGLRDPKTKEIKIRGIKDYIKAIMYEDEKRREWKDLGVVAKYVAKNIYETDYMRLNEYLDDIGLLIPTATLDTKALTPELAKQIKCYEIPRAPYVRMTPNKHGRVEHVEENLSYLDDRSLIQRWKEVKAQLGVLENIIVKAKVEMEKCPILQQERKLTCNYGSVSLIDSNPSYDYFRMYHDLGYEQFYSIVKPNMGLLDQYVELGIIHPNEIKQFRTIVDIRLDFVVMELEAENKMLNMFRNKTIRLSRNMAIS